MPAIIPEKSNRTRSAVHCQFWDNQEHSPRSIDGVTWKLPCEPTATPLSAPSGLSRSQQLIAAQAVGIPALPSYDDSNGGLVLDRNVFKMGGASWWSALSCRVKTQRMYTDSANAKAFQSSEISDWLKPLTVSSNYGLLSRTHAKAGPLVFDSTVEAGDVGVLSNAVYGSRSVGRRGVVVPIVQAATRPRLLPDVVVTTAARLNEALSTHSSLRMDVHGHSVGGSFATNLDVVECSGEYARVPKAVSFDIMTTTSQEGLQYRAGVYQVTAPSLDGSLVGEKEGLSAGEMRTSLHAQGAVAVEGEAYVWKPAKARVKEAGGKAAAVVEGKAAMDGDAGDAYGVGDGDGGEVDGGEEARSEIEGFVSSLEDGENGENGAMRDDEASSASEDVDSLPSSSSSPSPSPLLPTIQEKRRILPVTSTSIETSISESLKSLESIRSNVVRLTDEVHDGSLQRFIAGAGKRKARRARPYSFLLSQPHVKLAASLGCLVRMPLPNRFGLFGGASDGGTVGVATNGGVPNGGVNGVNGVNGNAPPTISAIPSLSRRLNASTTSLVSKSSISSQLADTWEPYLKRTTLRVFSSIGLSAQIGKFTRPFLDYSAMEVKLDLGLNSQHVVGSLPTASAMSAIDLDARPDKNRAFALEGKGVWHCCTISAAQQVFGPVRAKADFRFALDPTNVPQNQGDSRTLKGIAQTALSIRPSLLESMFGGDILIPGTEGAARVSCFWSPKRREGMVELRLF
jgi:hypothetical protein